MRWIYLLFKIATFGPILFWIGSFVAVIVLSGGFGCKINEGNVHPCIVLGQDIGDFAYMAGFYAAWGLLIIGPIVMIAAALWLLTALLHRWWLRRRANRPPPSP